MDLGTSQLSLWLMPWTWWVVISLAAWFFIVLLGWSCLAIAKQADTHLDEYAREHRRERRLRNRRDKP